MLRPTPAPPLPSQLEVEEPGRVAPGQHARHLRPLHLTRVPPDRIHLELGHGQLELGDLSDEGAAAVHGGRHGALVPPRVGGDGGQRRDVVVEEELLVLAELDFEAALAQGDGGRRAVFLLVARGAVLLDARHTVLARCRLLHGRRGFDGHRVTAGRRVHDRRRRLRNDVPRMRDVGLAGVLGADAEADEEEIVGHGGHHVELARDVDGAQQGLR